MPTIALKYKSSLTLVLVGSPVIRSTLTTHGPLPDKVYSYSKSTGPRDFPEIVLFSSTILEPPSGRILILKVTLDPFTSPVSLLIKNKEPMPTRMRKRLNKLLVVTLDTAPINFVILMLTPCSALILSKPGIGS